MPANVQTKPCSRCQNVKPLDEFSRSKRGKHGRHSWCRVCSRAQSREYHRQNCENPDYVASNRRRAKEWRLANRERVKGLDRAKHYRRTYGLTPAETDALFARGACEICGVTKGLCVDHCHATNKIRGLLCRGCNGAIGQLGDNAESLRAAVQYLERDAS